MITAYDLINDFQQFHWEFESKYYDKNNPLWTKVMIEDYLKQKAINNNAFISNVNLLVCPACGSSGVMQITNDGQYSCLECDLPWQT